MDYEQDLERIAQEYRDEGYSVVIHPSREQLHGLPGNVGELIFASRGSENVVVQVKKTRDDIGANPSDSQLVDQANSRPGWRYDLVVLYPTDPFRRLTRYSREPTFEEINQMLADAESAAEVGRGKESLVLAWAALDAVMRRAVAAMGVTVSGLASIEMVGILYSNGPLSLEQYDQLQVSLRIRLGIIHGLIPPDITPEMVRDVTAVTRDLLLYNPKVESVAG